MKIKFVNVWDNRRWGYIGFIVLQVEETDKFLTEKNFNPGYKFVIQALYNHVGAAGGHTFIPSHRQGIQEKSRKIDTNEADVLGLYLSNIKDIYDIPDDLYTKNFWGIMNTKREDNKDDTELECPCDEYYKVVFKREIKSFNHMASLFEKPSDLLNEIFDDDLINSIQNSTRKLRNEMIRMGADLNEESFRVYYGYVNKKTLEIKNVYWQLGTRSNEGVINKYLWTPNDEMPRELWDEVKRINEDHDDISRDDELYY
ncbi:MAG: hypothetical protein NAG76_14725 [Candidatus Pristimantibacillus lignocellulolyticus]|uniref:Uncharacterized protein n=1 Tax=Candidatus Pristimantibacillus lignocellulolyticus TaxID=2994561 RepID=A0A9J6ZAK1_9BACL|nr:MAG: hypothetical protein NAG76_14725 [Candidatus Pristimantibacillus lignocellulolyticus]